MCWGEQSWLKIVDQFLIHWKETTSFMPKMHNMNLIMRKHQEKKNPKPRLSNILQNNWPVLFKDVNVRKVNVMKGKERQIKTFMMKGD